MVTAGEKGRSRGRALGPIGIEVGETNALGGDAIDIGRADIGATVTGQVAMAEVVGDNKDNVGLLAALGAHRAVGSE